LQAAETEVQQARDSERIRKIQVLSNFLFFLVALAANAPALYQIYVCWQFSAAQPRPQDEILGQSFIFSFAT
jgi:hypothetical protein